MRIDAGWKSILLALGIAIGILSFVMFLTTIPIYYFLGGWAGATIYQTIMNMLDKYGKLNLTTNSQTIKLTGEKS